MNNFYLGIDQSLTSTGLVLLTDDGVALHRVVSSSKSLDKFSRMAEIAEFVSDILYTPEISFPRYIGIEGLPFGNLPGNVTRDLAGLQAVIITRLIDEGYFLDVDLFIIPPTTVKKEAVGKGKATKDEMVEALPDDFKKRVCSIPKSKGRYDIADAYFIAKATMEKANGHTSNT